MNLRARPLSRDGLALLAPLSLAVPAAGVAGRIHWPPWDEILSGAASGVAQELYFRGALLAVLTERLGRRNGGLVQAALFAAWHTRAFLVVDVPLATAVVAGSAVVGVLFAVQVMRDRTLVWVALFHSAFLIIQ